MIVFSFQPDFSVIGINMLEKEFDLLSQEIKGRYDQIIDRIVKVVKLLNRILEGIGKPLAVILECNISGEISKYGFSSWDEAKWSELKSKIGILHELNYLDVPGFMNTPPWN